MIKNQIERYEPRTGVVNWWSLATLRLRTQRELIFSYMLSHHTYINAEMCCFVINWHWLIVSWLREETEESSSIWLVNLFCFCLFCYIASIHNWAPRLTRDVTWKSNVWQNISSCVITISAIKKPQNIEALHIKRLSYTSRARTKSKYHKNTHDEKQR